MTNINSIVIVGGGSSGWFTASALNKHFPEIDVTLIESPDISTVGVGESTNLNINWFLQSLDMKDKDWMPHCDATYKATIKFTDFYKKGEAFHFPFGFQDLNHTNLKNEQQGHLDIGVDSWFFKKWLYPDTPQTDFAESFWPTMQMVNKNKVYPNKDGAIPNFNLQNDWAYQFDASKLGNWMKTNLCSETKYISDHVTNVNLTDKGWIDSLSTIEHGELKADLYIDCTGFSSVLLEKALKVPHTNYENELINNGTWVTRVPYIDQNVEMELTTDGVAIGNGWVWNIPIWSSISKGYVYSDKFIDKEIALKEFKEHLKETNLWCKENDVEELEYRHISIRNGIHEKAWHKNCIAIGLSCGFTEPLESQGLVFTIEGIRKLMIVLQSKDRHVNQFDRECFNNDIRNDIEGSRDFLVYHFVGSIRDDTEYWKWYTQEFEFEWNSKWEEISNMRFSFSPFGLSFKNLFMGAQCISIGHHINLYADYTTKSSFQFISYLKYCMSLDIDQVFEYWKKRNKKISLLADKCPTHYEYLKEKIYNQT